MAEKLTPNKDHNTPPANKATFLLHMRKAAQAKTVLEEATAAFNIVIKAAKNEGVNTKSLKAALKARRLDPDEVAKQVRDFERYMSWMGLPVGAQAALFEDDADEHTTEREDADQREWEAAEAGYRAGKGGEKADTCPFPDGSELNQVWTKQWLRGQAAIAAQMGPGVENVGAPKRGKGVPKPKRNDDGESVH